MPETLYRVNYVRVCTRKRKTVTADTLAFLQSAGYLGIRVTSYRPATDAEIKRYNELPACCSKHA